MKLSSEELPQRYFSKTEYRQYAPEKSPSIPRTDPWKVKIDTSHVSILKECYSQKKFCMLGLRLLLEC